mmetsp:Transcript_3362/g.7887  ORF Transcript_3362/g.7887 Transcript_3362/m.7887 type:complete len:87 (+) Transcript_3362:1422-1682(+)
MGKERSGLEMTMIMGYPKVINTALFNLKAYIGYTKIRTRAVATIEKTRVYSNICENVMINMAELCATGMNWYRTAHLSYNNTPGYI